MNRSVVVRGVTKRFGDFVAVNNVNLDIPAGSFYGIVGPNGAGKSTTLKICTMLLKPDFGNVWIGNDDIWELGSESKTRFGVLPDDLPLFDRLTGPEFLNYIGLLRNLEPEEVEQRAESLITTFELGGDQRSTLIADFSTGMRKKVALAAAMLHAPSVLFLDEPFESVDPIATRTIVSVLQRYCGTGGTVVLSSHSMPTVEQLCPYVAIINKGSVLASGSIESVIGSGTLEQAFLGAVGARDLDPEELNWLDQP